MPSKRVAARGGRIAHIDATLICERPKVGPHRDAIRAKIAEIMDLPLDRVAVKATTSERLGLYGAAGGHRGAGDGDRAAALKTCQERMRRRSDAMIRHASNRVQ